MKKNWRSSRLFQDKKVSLVQRMTNYETNDENAIRDYGEARPRFGAQRVFDETRDVIGDLQPTFRGIPSSVQQDVTQPKSLCRRELQLGPLDRPPDPKKVINDRDGGSQVRVILKRRTRTEGDVPVPDCTDDGIIQSIIALDENVDEGLCGCERLTSHPPEQCRLRSVIDVKRFREEFIGSKQGRVRRISVLEVFWGP